MVVQLQAVGATLAYAGIGTYVLALIINKVTRPPKFSKALKLRVWTTRTTASKVTSSQAQSQLRQLQKR